MLILDRMTINESGIPSLGTISAAVQTAQQSSSF